VTPAALREAKALSGHIRQRVKRAIGDLASNSRPPESRKLEIAGIEAEIRRLRLDQWRIIDAVTEAERAVDVLAVRKRPPYDYGDLQELINQALLPPEQQ
jgi:mRNA interferase RelE/StbE